jgi:CRP-like cAMP-binding protein
MDTFQRKPVTHLVPATFESPFNENFGHKLPDESARVDRFERLLPCSRPQPDANVSIGDEQRQHAPADGAVTAFEQASPGIKLPRHNRLKECLVSNKALVYVRDGVLALEVVPRRGRRQILDFLMPGDTIPASVSVTSPGFFLRALTDAALEQCSADDDQAGPGRLEPSTVICTFQEHIMRRNLHQMMLGQLDSESRVSSFLLMLALRCCHVVRPNLLLSMPMSRDDVADYLAMNSDTLSRIMMRLETLQIIRRFNRHSLHLIDDYKLVQLSPISTLLITAFGSVGLRCN